MLCLIMDSCDIGRVQRPRPILSKLRLKRNAPDLVDSKVSVFPVLSSVPPFCVQPGLNCKTSFTFNDVAR